METCHVATENVWPDMILTVGSSGVYLRQLNYTHLINKMCIQWRNALRKVWKLPYASHRDLVPLIAECVPLDVALVFRFIKFYRTVALSDNMDVNYIANTMTFAYRSTMGQNVRHIMSKYNMTHHELLYMPMSAIKHKCKEMWNSNVNATYYDNANIICELV